MLVFSGLVFGTQVLNKFKMFLWSLTQNSLLLRCNVKRSGVKLDIICLTCWTMDGYGAYSFFKCKAIKAFLWLLQLEELRCQLMQFLSAKKAVPIQWERKQKSQLTVLVIILMWCQGKNVRTDEICISVVNGIDFPSFKKGIAIQFLIIFF
jgi:hypothetical protein